MSKLIYTGNKFFHREIDLSSDEFKLYTLIRGFSGKKVIMTDDDNLKLPKGNNMVGKNILILGDFDKDLKSIFQDGNKIHISDDVDVSELRKRVVESGKNFPFSFSNFRIDECYDIGILDYDYVIATTGISYNYKPELNLNFVYPAISGILERDKDCYKVISCFSIKDILDFEYSFKR